MIGVSAAGIWGGKAVCDKATDRELASSSSGAVARRPAGLTAFHGGEIFGFNMAKRAESGWRNRWARGG
jgi:hypothetical protein